MIPVKQPPELFCKKSFFKSFANFTGKHLCWSLQTTASGFQWKSYLVFDVSFLLIIFQDVSVVLKVYYKHICQVTLTFQKAAKHIKYENYNFMIKRMNTNEVPPKTPCIWKG